MTTQKEKRMSKTSAYMAEFIGTFALIAAGAGSIIATHTTGGGPAALIAIALAHGLAIACFGSMLGAISGGHFNPAVTLALLLDKKILREHALGYIIAQLAGAIAAALALSYGFFPDAWQAAQLGTPMLAANISWGQGVFIETILTFFLVLAVFLTAVDDRTPKMGALFIGLIITMDILFGGPLTGAAMNPARTFGPAFVGWLAGASTYNPWANHLVYWIGPLAGAIVARMCYHKFFRAR